MILDDNRIKEIGSREALKCAGIGYCISLIPIILFAWFAPRDVLSNPGFLVPVILASVVLFVAAFFLGRVAALAISKSTNQLVQASVGIGLAWISVVVATVVGCLPNALLQGRIWNIQNLLWNLGDYVLKPLFWVCFVGCFPAGILGIYFTIRVRRALNPIMA